jgi:hypothetical protein
MPKKKIKRPVGPINPTPNPGPLEGLKPPMKGKKVATRRKGTQLLKDFNKNQAPVKAVSRAKAKKAFKGSSKNFQKAFTAYKRTIKKRKRATTRKESA